MPEIEIHASAWRLVEVGRVVLFTHGPYLGRLAVIVEIIDHKRVRESLFPPFSHESLLTLCSVKVLVDGPSKKENGQVPRHAVGLNNTIVTPIVIPKLPRAAGRGAVAKAWEKEDVESKWEQSAWAKRREQREKRKGLNDFERFKVMKLKKQVSIPFFNGGWSGCVYVRREKLGWVRFEQCGRLGDIFVVERWANTVLEGTIRGSKVDGEGTICSEGVMIEVLENMASES